MPYIDTKDRSKFNEYIDNLNPDNAGELNYVLTKIVHQYLNRNGDTHYRDYNEAVGVLESAKLELYRRSVAPYEDTKIAENGDVE